MSDHSTDEIRDLLAQAMMDAPEPHPWDDIEDRAQRIDTPTPVRRRTGLWLAAAACTIALVGGIVAVIASDDEPVVRTDDPTDTTVTTARSTTAPTPTTTLGTTEAGWTGGLLDDIDVESLRPLDSFTGGDAIVPTAPSGWRVFDYSGPGEAARVEVVEAQPDGSFGQALYLNTFTEPTCLGTRCRPSGESVTINDVVWEAIAVPGDEAEVFDVTYLRARIGDRWVSILADPFDVLSGSWPENPPIIEFLEGLRVGSPDDLATIGEACWQCAVFGKQGDPFAEASPSGTGSAQTDDGATVTSERPVSTPSDADPDIGRPLADIAMGDVVVATYIPPGLALNSAKILQEPRGAYTFSFLLERADAQHQYSTDFTVSLYESNGTLGPLGPQFLRDPNHPPIDIAGVTWGWNDFFATRVAHIGPFEVGVNFDVPDRSEAQRLLEGLRAVPLEQFPVPISINGADGRSVTEFLADAEIVASDDRFELAALQVGGYACVKLEETAVASPSTFTPDCWRILDGSGIVDLYPIGDTDTDFMIAGVMDSSVATAVRVTSPEGDSVVVPTGPVNQAIDGRFFLARLELDESDGLRLDQFTIEDASP